MRRILTATCAVLLVSLLGATGAGSTGSWRATPGGWASGSLDYVKTVPFEAGTGIDAVLHGRYLYTTSWRSFSIYDVRDPLSPELLSQTPVPGQLINENPQTNGKILLLSNDTFNQQLDVYDVRDKQTPRLIGTYEDPHANHMWTCVLDCDYAYGATGGILDLSDPTAPMLVGNWTGQKLPRAFHAITEVAPGLVMVGSDPIVYLDARDDPTDPSLLFDFEPKTTAPDRPYLVIGPAATSLPARTAWPQEGKADHIIVTMETPFSGECDDQSGTLLSYNAKDWDDEKKFQGFFLADEYEVTGNGLPNEGSAPLNLFGCSAYGLDANESYGDTGLIATTWFEHGTRVLRVGDDGRFAEVGGFTGHAGNAVRPLWRNDEVLYVIDAHRGIDVLYLADED